MECALRDREQLRVHLFQRIDSLLEFDILWRELCFLARLSKLLLHAMNRPLREWCDRCVPGGT